MFMYKFKNIIFRKQSENILAGQIPGKKVKLSVQVLDKKL